MKRTIISIVTSAILFLLINYFALMPLNPAYAGSCFWIILIAVVGALIAWNYDSYDFSVKENAGSIVYIVISCLLFLVIIITFIGSWGMFRASDYRAMAGEVQERTFSDEITAVDMTQLPIVDIQLAKNLADKKLGEQAGLGSSVTIPDGTFCSVNGKLMYVFPLVHSDLFKYWGSPEGTPGYITVSATDQSDVKLVTELDGKAIHIQYQPQAFFSRDLKRYLYNHYSKTVGYTDMTFELDDNGYPYWTVTLYKHSIGYFGDKVTGLLVVDAQTGEIKHYNLDEIPVWVDRVYPKEFIETQIDDWGKYIHGFWNWSDKDKLKETQGDGYLYNNGQCYLYSGITSVGADESTVGFTLTDLRTHETSIFYISGATEEAAKASIEGKVQQMGYVGDYPYLINVEGVATYFSPLKDLKGLVKMYGFCSVQDYTIVGVGESVAEAKNNYIKALRGVGNDLVIEKAEDAVTFEGTVERIGISVDGGSSYYTMVIKEIPDKLFIGSQSLSNEMPITLAGDKVSIEYNESDSFLVELMGFDNLMYTQAKSEAQVEKEQQAEAVDAEKDAEQTEKENESLMDQDLTPEQQQQLNDALKDIIGNGN